MNKTLYTVQKCRIKDDVFYGSVHSSQYCEITLCGKTIDEKWCILSNGFDGTVTCKECLKIEETICNSKKE